MGLEQSDRFTLEKFASLFTSDTGEIDKYFFDGKYYSSCWVDGLVAGPVTAIVRAPTDKNGTEIKD